MVEHVDEDDAERPYIGRTCCVCWRDVVSTFIAHVRSTPTVHVAGGGVCGRQTKVGEFDGDVTGGIGGFGVGDEKVFWFDIAMEDASTVTGLYGFTHLGEHGGDQRESAVGKKLCWRKSSECSWRRILVFGLFVALVMGLFQKVIEIFAGNILENEKEIGRGF